MPMHVTIMVLCADIDYPRFECREGVKPAGKYCRELPPGDPSVILVILSEDVLPLESTMGESTSAEIVIRRAEVISAPVIRAIWNTEFPFAFLDIP